jgi:trans-aconitate 2-methyltransferase
MSDVIRTDWDAERYHRLSEPQLAWGKRVMARLAPVPGERILDLGCGTGRLTTELLERIGEGHVVGLDRSATMLAEAVARCAARPPVTPLHDANTSPSRLSFVQGDGAALPFADAFDAVFSTATLHWILDHELVFASVYRALAPGGRFIAQCGGGPNLARLLARARGLMSSRAYAAYFDRWREPWEFADVPTTMMRLERAGFTSVDASLEPASTTLPDRATYADFVTCVCLRPHVARLPEGARAEFIDLLAGQAEADAPPFSLDYWRLNLSGRKPNVAEQAA